MAELQDTITRYPNGIDVGRLLVDGVEIDATGDELDLLDGAIAGTNVAGKSLVADSNKRVDELHTGTLYLGAAAGTAVTAVAAELNAVDGAPMAASITPGVETGGDTISVAIQLKDAAGADLAIRGSVFAYLSDDAAGDSVAATAPSGGVVIGIDGVAIPVVAGKAFQLISEADGDIDLTIVEAAGATWYLIIILANGKLQPSAAITFA